MIVRQCVFSTSRLLVKEWHSFTSENMGGRVLPDVVAAMLTPSVTRQLPTGWQGAYTRERAQQWIADRDAEGVTLLVVERGDGNPVGLVILFESGDAAAQKIELRLGYLLSEESWGRGLASELLEGFVGWCRTNAISSVEGGVERGNDASRRVLEKNGFLPVSDQGGDESEEQVFRLQLRP